MKKNWVSCGICVCLSGMFQVHAQGFINLNFESAGVPISQPPSPPGVPTVDIGLALPGWSAFIGTNQANMVMYNSPTLDTSAVSLFRDDISVNYPFLNVIEGSFSVFLLGGYIASTPTDTSLTQTGLVPATAQSIRFKTSNQVGPYHRVVVSLDGQTLSKVPLQVTSQYTLFGADVTLFAGEIRELRFTVYASTDGGGGIPELLDSIVFSPEAIPEPSVLGLFALGALLVGFGLRAKQRP